MYCDWKRADDIAAKVRVRGAAKLVASGGLIRPEVLGTDVSHGCIRVDNATITRLARTVPLGTPVEISRS